MTDYKKRTSVGGRVSPKLGLSEVRHSAKSASTNCEDFEYLIIFNPKIVKGFLDSEETSFD